MEMRIFPARDNALISPSGEYILGSEETGSHACYMIYGILKPGERGRVVKPGKGHEEILLAMRGEIEVSGARTGVVKEGTAFHVAGDEECLLENRGTAEAVYVIAGGHSGGGHH